MSTKSPVPTKMYGKLNHSNSANRGNYEVKKQPIN